jgi:cobalt/nickel transport system permease protein
MVGKLDARAKLVAVVLSIVIVSTGPPGAWRLVALQVALALAISAFSGVNPRAMAGRLAVGIPFVAMAGVLLWLGSGWERGLTVVLKGTCALALLTSLSLTTAVSELVWAIRKLGAPKSVNLIASMMLRYIDMLAEEFSRMSRARAARCGGPLAGVALFQVHGNQTGLLLVRSWERAERIHSAMLSRGFTGEMPETASHHFGASEWAVTALIPAAFLAVRLAVNW